MAVNPYIRLAQQFYNDFPDLAERVKFDVLDESRESIMEALPQGLFHDKDFLVRPNNDPNLETHCANASRIDEDGVKRYTTSFITLTPLNDRHERSLSNYVMPKDVPEHARRFREEFGFHHEVMHALIALNGFNYKDQKALDTKQFHESACDAYSALRLVQAHGEKAIPYIQYWADTRQFSQLESDSSKHYTTLSLDDVLSHVREAGVDSIKAMAPEEVMIKALDIALEHKMSADALVAMEKQFKSFHSDYKEILDLDEPRIAARFREAVLRHVDLSTDDGILQLTLQQAEIINTRSSIESRVHAVAMTDTRLEEMDTPTAEKTELVSLIDEFADGLNSKSGPEDIKTLFKPLADFDMRHGTDAVGRIEDLLSRRSPDQVSDRLKTADEIMAAQEIRRAKTMSMFSRNTGVKL